MQKTDECLEKITVAKGQVREGKDHSFCCCHGDMCNSKFKSILEIVDTRKFHFLSDLG